MPIQTRRLSHALGAEITGIDLREPLSDATFRQINDIFLEHGVLLFRGQALTYAGQDAALHSVVRYAKVGAEIRYNSPEEFQAFIRTEVTKWAKVIRAAGVSVEAR